VGFFISHPSLEKAKDGVPYRYHRSSNATGGTLIWVEKVIETVASHPDRLSGIPHWLKPI
jgi:hypothetical protein